VKSRLQNPPLTGRDSQLASVAGDRPSDNYSGDSSKGIDPGGLLFYNFRVNHNFRYEQQTPAVNSIEGDPKETLPLYRLLPRKSALVFLNRYVK
jgi:hypothetical protein